LRILGAIVLWCASSWGAAQTHPEAAAAGEPERVELATLASASLEGRSAYWQDAAGTEDVQQLESANAIPWQLRRPDEPQRLHGGALWIQFEAVVPPGEHWYLEVGNAIYDHVQLFHRDRSGAWVVQEGGTQMAVAEWTVPGRLPTFALAADDPRPVRYWLRVADERADFSAPLTLLREDALQRTREREQFLFGAYFGLAGLVALAALANGLVFRDRAFLAFAIYNLLLVAAQLGRAGVGAQHLWPESQPWNNAVLALWPGAATAGALWFVRVLTDPARLSRALDLAVIGLIAALLGAVALDLVIGTRSSLTLVLSITGLSLAAIATMLVWGWLDGKDRHLGLVALGFVPVLVMALFPLARGFGLIPTNLLSRFGLFFGVAIELPILYYALNMRLMARRESELRAGALTRTDPLTGLPHRQALTERLDASLARARGQKQQCALMGVRISNLEAIAEEFGRDAAEKALVVAASHLRRMMVDFDMAARVGPREFAILLETPVTPELATSRAQQVVASGLRQVEALPAALTLKFHVTVAMLPHPHLDGAASLDWVLDGLEQITPDAKKLIRPLNF
jgi:diguanylate cyclase (GGDEF)-like protein